TASKRDRESKSAALSGGQAAMRHGLDALESEPSEPAERRLLRTAGSPRREAQVLRDGQVVVAEVLVAQQREVATVTPPVDREVDAEHLGLARPQRQESRDQAQQRGLAGPIRSRQQHDLSGGDVEVDARERRKAVEQADGGAEADDEHKLLRD